MGPRERLPDQPQHPAAEPLTRGRYPAIGQGRHPPGDEPGVGGRALDDDHLVDAEVGQGGNVALLRLTEGHGGAQPGRVASRLPHLTSRWARRSATSATRHEDRPALDRLPDSVRVITVGGDAAAGADHVPDPRAAVAARFGAGRAGRTVLVRPDGYVAETAAPGQLGRIRTRLGIVPAAA
ncbi:MAG: hypothetical protein QOE37_1502 [Microbacteriaceae bacterium]|nr:hypothetical protein [Microbacteriaceae bacterium]